MKIPYWLGKNHSEETKRKLSLIQTGRKLSEETKRKIGLKNKGHKCSEENKIRISFENKGNTYAKGHIPSNKNKLFPQVSGSKNGSWKGGVNYGNKKIRESLKYRQWRSDVFTRDNFTCQWCGDNTGGNLQADHIRPFALFPELRFAIDNGRTLCISCHKKTDSYGYNFKKCFQLDLL